jgi:hypothetical protein
LASLKTVRTPSGLMKFSGAFFKRPGGSFCMFNPDMQLDGY